MGEVHGCVRFVVASGHAAPRTLHVDLHAANAWQSTPFAARAAAATASPPAVPAGGGTGSADDTVWRILFSRRPAERVKLRHHIVLSLPEDKEVSSAHAVLQVVWSRRQRAVQLSLQDVGSTNGTRYEMLAANDACDAIDAPVDGKDDAAAQRVPVVLRQADEPVTVHVGGSIIVGKTQLLISSVDVTESCTVQPIGAHAVHSARDESVVTLDATPEDALVHVHAPQPQPQPQPQRAPATVTCMQQPPKICAESSGVAEMGPHIGGDLDLALPHTSVPTSPAAARVNAAARIALDGVSPLQRPSIAASHCASMYGTSVDSPRARAVSSMPARATLSPPHHERPAARAHTDHASATGSGLCIAGAASRTHTPISSASRAQHAAADGAVQRLDTDPTARVLAASSSIHGARPPDMAASSAPTAVTTSAYTGAPSRSASISTAALRAMNECPCKACGTPLLLAHLLQHVVAVPSTGGSVSAAHHFSERAHATCGPLLDAIRCDMAALPPNMRQSMTTQLAGVRAAAGALLSALDDVLLRAQSGDRARGSEPPPASVCTHTLAPMPGARRTKRGADCTLCTTARMMSISGLDHTGTAVHAAAAQLEAMDEVEEVTRRPSPSAAAQLTVDVPGTRTPSMDAFRRTPAPMPSASTLGGGDGQSLVTLGATRPPPAARAQRIGDANSAANVHHDVRQPQARKVAAGATSPSPGSRAQGASLLGYTYKSNGGGGQQPGTMASLLGAALPRTTALGQKRGRMLKPTKAQLAAAAAAHAHVAAAAADPGAVTYEDANGELLDSLHAAKRRRKVSLAITAIPGASAATKGSGMLAHEVDDLSCSQVLEQLFPVAPSADRCLSSAVQDEASEMGDARRMSSLASTGSLRTAADRALDAGSTPTSVRSPSGGESIRLPHARPGLWSLASVGRLTRRVEAGTGAVGGVEGLHQATASVESLAVGGERGAPPVPATQDDFIECDLTQSVFDNGVLRIHEPLQLPAPADIPVAAAPAALSRVGSADTPATSATAAAHAPNHSDVAGVPAWVAHRIASVSPARASVFASVFPDWLENVQFVCCQSVEELRLACQHMQLELQAAEARLAGKTACAGPNENEEDTARVAANQRALDGACVDVFSWFVDLMHACITRRGDAAHASSDTSAGIVQQHVLQETTTRRVIAPAQRDQLHEDSATSRAPRNSTTDATLPNGSRGTPAIEILSGSPASSMVCSPTKLHAGGPDVTAIPSSQASRVGEGMTTRGCGATPSSAPSPASSTASILRTPNYVNLTSPQLARAMSHFGMVEGDRQYMVRELQETWAYLRERGDLSSLTAARAATMLHSPGIITAAAANAQRAVMARSPGLWQGEVPTLGGSAGHDGRMSPMEPRIPLAHVLHVASDAAATEGTEAHDAATAPLPSLLDDDVPPAADPALAPASTSKLSKRAPALDNVQLRLALVAFIRKRPELHAAAVLLHEISLDDLLPSMRAAGIHATPTAIRDACSQLGISVTKAWRKPAAQGDALSASQN